MRDNHAVTRRVALGLIGAGALLTASETLGFTEVFAGRSMGVTVADDESAMLGIVGREASTTPAFTNNTTNASMTVELASDDDVEFDPTGDGNFQPTVQFEIGPGDTQEVELGGNEEEAVVHIAAELTNATTGSAVGTIDLVRQFDIPQAAAIRDVVGSVTSAGNSGKFEFSLVNTQPADGQTVILSGIRIDSTDVDQAHQVGGHGDDILMYEGTSIINEIMFVGGDFHTFSHPDQDDTITLDPGADYDFEFDRFREEGGGGGSQVGVNEVDITLQAQDGSTARIELRE